jgi:hypothetical protein
MLALIKREIQDFIVYFIAAILSSAVLVALLITAAFHFERLAWNVFTGLTIPLIVILVIGSSGMGVTQMYLDRNRRISAFLSTLPVTRSRLLTAKIVTGVLAILIVLVPVTIAAVALRHLLLPPIPVFANLITDFVTTTFLMLCACYCLGLLTGWTTNKITPTFGALGLNLILYSLIVVKGFGPEIRLLLVLVIAACLIRTWHKFTSTSL